MSNNMDNKEGKKVETVVETKETATVSIKSTSSPKMTENQLSSLDYTEFDTPAKMLALGNVLCKSKLVPLKAPEDVVVALMTGKELGLPFVTSVSQIYPINGRPTLGIHIQKALCLKNGIIFEKVEDAEAIYQFAQKDKEGKVMMKNGKPVIVHTGTMKERPENTAFSEITRRTKYKVTRYIKVPTGEYEKVVAYGSFTLQEANDAGLLEKEVWIKYWKRMLDARSLGNAIKEIASDITLGLYTPDELNADITVSEEGTIDVVHTEIN